MDTAIKSSTISLYACAIDARCAMVNCLLDYKHLEYNVIHVDPISHRQIGFSGQRQLPVLRIGEGWRSDPTAIALWVEKLYPQRPVLGEDAEERLDILELNRWVTDSVIPAMIRRRLAWNRLDDLYTGWRLAMVLHRARRLPRWRRLVWPWTMRSQHRGARLETDRFWPTESLESMDARIHREWLKRLGDGPFLGGRGRPSFADLGAYPALVADYLLGLNPNPPWGDAEPLLDWLRRVQAELPANPLLAPDDCLVNPPPR